MIDHIWDLVWSLWILVNEQKICQESHIRDFPGGPVVKNSPSNSGDVGLIPGQGTKILYAAGQLSPQATYHN